MSEDGDDPFLLDEVRLLLPLPLLLLLLLFVRDEDGEEAVDMFLGVIWLEERVRDCPGPVMGDVAVLLCPDCGEGEPAVAVAGGGVITRLEGEDDPLWEYPKLLTPLPMVRVFDASKMAL